MSNTCVCPKCHGNGKIVLSLENQEVITLLANGPKTVRDLTDALKQNKFVVYARLRRLNAINLVQQVGDMNPKVYQLVNQP